MSLKDSPQYYHEVLNRIPPWAQPPFVATQGRRFHAAAQPSSTSRTFRASVFGAKGLGRNASSCSEIP